MSNAQKTKIQLLLVNGFWKLVINILCSASALQGPRFQDKQICEVRKKTINKKKLYFCFLRVWARTLSKIKVLAVWVKMAQRGWYERDYKRLRHTINWGCRSNLFSPWWKGVLGHVLDRNYPQFTETINCDDIKIVKKATQQQIRHIRLYTMFIP